MSSPNSTERDYIQKSGVEDLLLHLAMTVIQAEPESPEECILASLKALKGNEHTQDPFGPRVSFTDEELRALFEGLDASRTGIVPSSDVQAALKTISINDSTRTKADIINIPGNVDVSLFVELAHSLMDSSLTKP